MLICARRDASRHIASCPECKQKGPPHEMKISFIPLFVCVRVFLGGKDSNSDDDVY